MCVEGFGDEKNREERLRRNAKRRETKDGSDTWVGNHREHTCAPFVTCQFAFSYGKGVLPTRDYSPR